MKEGENVLMTKKNSLVIDLGITCSMLFLNIDFTVDTFGEFG